ncbi:MAG TPA: type IV secretory system conjugative DNA transfer family protein [Symbiobacteriaceae bacterium]|nr:type IV secretory system conjugative DNA transfer family protein [Symbiobacteriaceae bacterium]
MVRQWVAQNRPILIIIAVLTFADLFILPTALGTDQYRPWVIFQAIAGQSSEARAVAGEWFLLNLAAGGGILYWLIGRKPKHKAPDDASQYASHGSNRWARKGELRAHLKREGPGLILGRADDGLLTLPPDPTLPFNQNVTVLGSSGSRKTRSFVQPNLLQEALHKQASCVVVDPKGENFRRSAHLLRAAGYEVRLLNFLDMAHSDRWNPLAAVSSTTDAADLAVNVVANTINPNRPAGGADPFWDQAEQSFITALVLYITQHRPEAERHMASVLELGAELHPNNLDYVFLQLPADAPARRFYRTFLRADPKVRAGVVAGIGSRLQLWNIPEVIRLTAASDFDLRDLGRRKMALFLVIPDSKATYAPVLALFWQQTFQLLYEVADKNGGTLPNPVRCVMDEIANCGYIPDYAMKKSTMRSRRISTEEIWQSLGQMKNRYPHTWTELLANSDHLLVLGVNDLDTAQYISQLLGTTTINIVGTGNTEGSTGGSASTSRTFIGRPLLTPDECRRLGTDEALLLPKSNFPARIIKVDYTAHPLAGQIQEVDHRAYQVPQHAPPTVINTSLLRDAVLPAEQQQPPPPDDDEAPEDVTAEIAPTPKPQGG